MSVVFLSVVLIPWVPETFLPRFPVSIKSLEWPTRKASGAERYCLMALIQSLADFGQDGWLAPNDHLRDFESNRRYNWLTTIDQHVKEYFQLYCWHDVSVPARSVVMAATESFEWALKESIPSNVLGGFDGVGNDYNMFWNNPYWYIRNLHNNKRFSFCPWMWRFPTMFFHARYRF